MSTSALDPALYAGPKPAVTAGRAMVVSSHPTVTEVALDVLRDGGNAVDAVLTAIPLQQVLEPQLSTIAGGFGMLHRDGSTGCRTYLNANPDHASGTTASRQPVPETSGTRVAVPGTVAGMRAAAERFGTRPWDSYFTPAITAATDGFEMYPQLYAAIRAALPRVTQHPSGRERYLPDGHLPIVGRSFRQHGLAEALSRIGEPDGAEWFQRGAFAERFVDAVRGTGGTLTRDDLAAYAPRWDEPLEFPVGGHTLLGPALPDTGGLYCAFALCVLERTDLARRGRWDARAIALVARAQREADAHVDRYGADPRGHEVPVDVLLSPAYLDATAQLISRSLPHGATRSRSPVAPRRRVGSNQLVVVDAEGTWVTVLHTGYGTDFGTGLVVDGVGVNAAADFPGDGTGRGRRVVAPLAPILILRDGQPRFGLGTPGYPPPWVTLVLLNLLTYGMSLEDALDAPRFAFDPTDDATLTVESRVPASTLGGLQELGIGARPLGEHDPATGRMNAVQRADDGRLIGVVDPRSAGLAAGLA